MLIVLLLFVAIGAVLSIFMRPERLLMALSIGVGFLFYASFAGWLLG